MAEYDNHVSYIYLIQDGKDKGTNIYKIGRTTQSGSDIRKLRRIMSYSHGTIIYNIFNVNPCIVNDIERSIKDAFRKKYTLVRGSEWFAGDVISMKKDIDAIIESNALSNSVHLTTSNNVFINSFGNENLEHVSMDVANECLYLGESGLINMIDKIYFDENIPENHNVRSHKNNINVVDVFTDHWKEHQSHEIFDVMIRNSIIQIMMKKDHKTTYYRDDVYKLCDMSPSMKKRLYKIIKQKLGTRSHE